MKKIVLLISAIVFSISVFDEPLFLKYVQTDLNNSIGFNNNLSNTFKLIYLNGAWWIYEFDEVGLVVNIFPAD